MNELIREIEKEQLKASVDEFRVGDTVKFALDLSKMHIFDKESSLAIAF